MHTTLIQLTIAARGVVSTVTGSSEREIARLGEAILRRHRAGRVLAGYEIECADAFMRERIVAYLQDVSLELELETELG